MFKPLILALALTGAAFTAVVAEDEPKQVVDAIHRQLVPQAKIDVIQKSVAPGFMKSSPPARWWYVGMTASSHAGRHVRPAKRDSPKRMAGLRRDASALRCRKAHRLRP